MSEQVLETYHGNCHCGAFQFSVRLPQLKQVVACDCSICLKKGYLWGFPPSNDSFVVEKGDGTLKEYQFGKKTMAHKFCPTCGTPVMGQRHVEGPSIGVNVRTFRDFDEEKLEIKPYNGAGLEPHYVPPSPPEVSDLSPSTKCYQGSCHCGNVSYQLQSKALEEIEVLSCNCSICSRNGDLWIYPSEKDVKLRGDNHLTVYRFARKVGGHAFCSTCGVPVVNKLNFDDPDGELPESVVGTLPVNVRTINGVDLKALKVVKVDGKSLRGPPYEG